MDTMISVWRYLTSSQPAERAQKDERVQASILNDISREGKPSRRLRLTINNGSRRLRGYPPKSTGFVSGHLVLDSPSGGELCYILGVDWQSKVTFGDEHAAKIRFLQPYSYSFAPGNPEEEAEHCLRMRRCGASIVLSDDLQERFRSYNQKAGKQIMGWPSDGGVWVYRVQKVAYDYTVEEVRRTIEMKMKLRVPSDMDGFCEVLQAAGAKYYETISDCPEVKQLCLADAVQSASLVSDFVQSAQYRS